MANRSEVKKILVIKLRKLGDVINTTPTVRAVHEAYPEAEIVFITEPLGAKVYEFSSFVDKVWLLRSGISLLDYIKLCYQVRSHNFDLVIDLFQHNKTKLLTLFSGAKRRLGFTSSPTNKRHIIYTHTQHITEKNCQTTYSAIHNLWLLEKIGLKVNDWQVEFPIDQATIDFAREFTEKHGIDKKTIAFCAQTERAIAQVPTDLLVSIGNYLITEGYKLYFIYGPGERPRAEQVFNQIDVNSACIIDYAVPTIAQVRGILQYCFMYVGNDGGNKHLAVAAGIPTLGLFWQDNPPLWTPPEPVKHQFLQTANVAADLLEEFKRRFQSLI